MIKLNSAVWYGFTTFPGTPVEGARCPNSPALVTSVEALKSGKNLLRISVVEAVQSVRPRRRTITLKVLRRAARHLVGTFMDEHDSEQTAVLSEMSYAWMEAFCHDWWRRFPMRSFAPYHYYPDGIDIQEYLGHAFPGSPERIGEAIVLDAAALRPMPAARVQLMVRHEFGEMDSYLIRRGFRSTQMEQKWDAEFSDDCLRLYRSWTGIMIYEIPMSVRGARMYAGAVSVNRDPEQHAIRDDDLDRVMSGYVIFRVLLGLPADFPVPKGMSAEQAGIAAWAVAGSAS